MMSNPLSPADMFVKSIMPSKILPSSTDALPLPDASPSTDLPASIDIISSARVVEPWPPDGNSKLNVHLGVI